jgi:F420-non-reducing hydrogenase small subunit
LTDKSQPPTDDDEILSAPEKDPHPEDHIIELEDLSLANQDKAYYEANQTIFSQGEKGETLYIIAEGSVEIFQESINGKCVLARLGARDIFGEIALLTDLPRTATALTLEPTSLISLKRSEFFSRVRSEPELAFYVLQVLIMRLRKIHQTMVEPEESIDVVQHILPPLVKHEGLAKVAIISLSTCGGCAAMILQDQEELASLLERVQISYCPMLMDHGEIKDEVDVAIVDGAVRVKEDEEKLKEARKKSRHLVAWGTCAALGGIPTLANQYELEEVIEASYGQTQDPFDYYLSESRDRRGAIYESEDLALLRRAGKVADFVRVDYYLPGCPPQPILLNQLVKELRGEPQSGKPRQIVCVECIRKPRKMEVETLWVFPKSDWDPTKCFSSGGAPCLGFLTRGGCGSVCPNNGLPCWGCRGPSVAALKKVNDGDTFEQVVYSSLIKRCLVAESEIGAVMRILRSRGSSLLNFYHDTAFDLSKVR